MKNKKILLVFVCSCASIAKGAATVPLTSACSAPLRVNFWGDFFVDSKRASEASLASIAPILSWAHFNVANFEGNIAPKNPLNRAFPSFPYALSMPPKAASILKDAGVLHLTRANNHTMDFGALGMRHTSQELLAQGIAFAGVGKNSREAIKPMTLKNESTSVAVLSFATTWPEESWANTERAGIAYPTEERLNLAIREARSRHDFVVVAFHWGPELSTELRPYQHGLADAAIKAGANLIYGHHAHMAQGLQTINNIPIAWGLGNFLFSSIGKRTNMSVGMHVEFCKEKDAQSIQVAYTPFETGSQESQTTMIPLTRQRFLKLSKHHQKTRIIDSNTLFFIAPEKKILTFREWIELPENTEPTPAQNTNNVTQPPS
jgi:hypothetical protein